MKTVSFANDTKNYDGSHENLINYYKIVAGFFGIKEMNVKKVGVDSGTVIELRKHNFLIPCKIKEKTILESVSTTTDVLRVSSFDSKLIQYCIQELESILTGLQPRDPDNSKIDKAEEVDEFWDKECLNDVCHERYCCLNKKAKLRQQYNRISLIRKGSRDFGVSIDIKQCEFIFTLINLLKDALEENENIDYDWFKYMDDIEHENAEENINFLKFSTSHRF